MRSRRLEGGGSVGRSIYFWEVGAGWYITSSWEGKDGRDPSLSSRCLADGSYGRVQEYPWLTQSKDMVA